jgi:hypothetical protein
MSSAEQPANKSAQEMAAICAERMPKGRLIELLAFIKSPALV